MKLYQLTTGDLRLSVDVRATGIEQKNEAEETSQPDKHPEADFSDLASRPNVIFQKSWLVIFSHIILPYW